jgi:rRNA-processing protein FCF1
LFPPGGPNATDDEIAERVTRVGNPKSIRVVTSDKGLAERVETQGVEVVPVGRFRRLLDGSA